MVSLLLEQDRARDCVYRGDNGWWEVHTPGGGSGGGYAAGYNSNMIILVQEEMDLVVVEVEVVSMVDKNHLQMEAL